MIVLENDVTLLCLLDYLLVESWKKWIWTT